MFEKKEDKLFGYAFGDLDAHEAQVFEAGLLKDEISAEEAKFLQSIKGDLVSLRDIPEMQFSKERLRSAILGQGLKPTRPGLPWLNWVMAPGAVACVLALGYVLMNGTSRKDPTMIGAPTVANASGSGPKLPVQELKKPEPIVAMKSGSDDSFPDVSDNHWAYDKVGERNISRISRKSDKGSKRPTQTFPTKSPLVAMNDQSKDVFETVKESVLSSASLSSKGRDSGNTGAARSVSDVSMKAEPLATVEAKIILIDKDQDSGVGAPVATEVNDTRNVIIGG